VFLLFDHRYAHINIPTMRGVNMMIVIVVRGLFIHIERQYTNANEIWQALNYFSIHIIANFVQLRSKFKLNKSIRQPKAKWIEWIL